MSGRQDEETRGAYWIEKKTGSVPCRPVQNWRLRAQGFGFGKDDVLDRQEDGSQAPKDCEMLEGAEDAKASYGPYRELVHVAEVFLRHFNLRAPVIDREMQETDYWTRYVMSENSGQTP